MSVGEDPTPRVRPQAWAKPFLAVLVGLDALCAAVSAAVAFLVRFGDGHGAINQHAAALYLPMAFALPLAWVAAVWLADTYDARTVGLGSEEFARLGKAFVGLIAVVGFTSYALKAAVPRGYVVIALPLALVLSMIAHYAARKVLHRLRASGRATHRVVVVGDAASVVELSARIHEEAYAGLTVVGACIPAAQMSDPQSVDAVTDAGVRLLADTDSVLSAVARSGADTVAVTSGRALSPTRLRALSWQLEGSDADLLVAPGLVEVAGPRLHIRPMTGLPLLHIDKPEFAGSRRILKSVVDRSAAALGLLVLSPLLAVVCVAVKVSSRGPVFFKQTRTGRNGKEFRIWKFRSMYVDAEARLDALTDRSDGNEMLFKMKADPRVTRVGAFLRRYSIDELPQLINVLNGSMSLVGPRPPLPAEVARYGSAVRRRLLVPPGLTGLWQVSGRSDLSWEESVRLDLRYVENWSLGQDAMILWKTLSAVLRGSGAY